MLECDGIGSDEVQAVDFGQQVLFTEFRVLTVAFVDMNPDEASEILGCEGELGPVFAAVVVALIGCGASEAQRETNDETQDGKQKLVDADCGM